MTKKTESNVSNELIFKNIKSMQATVAQIPKLQSGIHDLHTLIREGFSALNRN